MLSLDNRVHNKIHFYNIRGIPYPKYYISFMSYLINFIVKQLLRDKEIILKSNSNKNCLLLKGLIPNAISYFTSQAMLFLHDFIYSLILL